MTIFLRLRLGYAPNLPPKMMLNRGMVELILRQTHIFSLIQPWIPGEFEATSSQRCFTSEILKFFFWNSVKDKKDYEGLQISWLKASLHCFDNQEI
eukprot:s731_g25.t1